MTAFDPRPTIGARLGNGHFGTVYEGDCPVHRRVAVKVIEKPPGHTDDEWEEYKLRLLKEASNLSLARHPNVVPVHYVYPSPDRDAVCMVMQRCECSAEQVYLGGPLTMGAVRKIATDVGQGLMALHERGMLHRDIKPGNILLNLGSYLLSDFGLVTDNMVFGYGSMANYNYSDHIASEVWTNCQTSPKTDIWALGMTLYRLLHGHTWYQKWYRGRVQVQVRKGGFASRLRWLPHVPDDWRRLIRKSMHDEPSYRYQSCDDLLNGLAKLQVEPAWTCVVEPDQVTWSLTRKSRVTVVEWTRVSTNRHTWSALSLPTGTGKKRSLGGGEAPAAPSSVIGELEGFFASFGT